MQTEGAGTMGAPRGLKLGEKMVAAAATRPISVLVVDDHPIMRDGIAAILDAQADISVVGQAGNGVEAVDAYRQHRPDVTVMDLSMPVIDGVAATMAIRQEWPDARIVMLTTYSGDAQALRALKAGASGYLLKSLVRTDLLDAIRSIHGGQRRVVKEVAAGIAEHVGDEGLSARELEVLRHVAAGNSNRRVAVQLGISEETVKVHMKNILGKLAANDRTHAVTIALTRGFIEV
jgi:DNA-binding NarL/FixJ family response regulator